MCIVSSFTHLKMFKFRNFPIRWDMKCVMWNLSPWANPLDWSCSRIYFNWFFYVFISTSQQLDWKFSFRVWFVCELWDMTVLHNFPHICFSSFYSDGSINSVYFIYCQISFFHTSSSSSKRFSISSLVCPFPIEHFSIHSRFTLYRSNGKVSRQ